MNAGGRKPEYFRQANHGNSWKRLMVLKLNGYVIGRIMKELLDFVVRAQADQSFLTSPAHVLYKAL